MSRLTSASYTEMFSLFGSIQHQLGQSPCFETAAQQSMDLLYEHFADCVVLSRVYVTARYGDLPLPNRQFVDKLAHAKAVTMTEDAPVLSLMASRGRKPAWNNRRQSSGHVGIPLVSADFVSALPMIARLLSDFEIKLEWIERPERGISTLRSGWSGLFWVSDARTDKDQFDRLIIPAQDFVAEQDVRTVFGVGGSYSTGTMFAMIFFVTCSLSRDQAQRFLPLSNLFKTATNAHVEANRIFAAGNRSDPADSR